MARNKNESSDSAEAAEIVITRSFAASRQLVFETWTDPVHLQQWWGPRGFANPVCDWTVQPGGKIRHVMRAPDGTDYPMGGQFREIEPPEKLVFTTSALDGQGEAMFEFLHVVTFTEADGRTTVTITSRLVSTSPGSERFSNGYRAGMTQSLERLAELLVKVSGREIVVSRVLHAPRELVWQAWTEPQHVAQWWGPRGFSTTIKQMDFRVGGIWEHTMRGPDGVNYPNKSSFKEIVPLERVTYAHGGGREDGPGASFTATWTFETVEGNKTRLTGRMVFQTAEARDFVVREFGAVEGARQTVERASEYLALLQMEPFVISREFNAPRDLMWKVWTEREHFARWFGPKGIRVEFAQFDLRPGGMNHYSMQMPDGKVMWGKSVYREIVPPEKLVWINSFSDKDAGITRHPLTTELWPLQLLTVVTFAENAGKTTVTVTWVPYESDAAERRVFDSGRGSMAMGWGGTLDQLTAYLMGGVS